MMVTLVLSFRNFAFHLANVFLILLGAEGSFFFLPFLPFFFAGHTFSASSMYIMDG